MSTPARKAQLIADLREQREALYAAIERLPDADLARLTFDRDRERSSVCEELIRLADAEVAYRRWIERARAVNGADVRTEVLPTVDLDADDAASHSIDVILDVLTLERRETLASIRDLEPPDFLRRVLTPTATLSVDDLVAALARHERALTSAITRRDASLLPRYYARTRGSGLERA